MTDYIVHIFLVAPERPGEIITEEVAVCKDSPKHAVEHAEKVALGHYPDGKIRRVYLEVGTWEKRGEMTKYWDSESQ